MFFIPNTKQSILHHHQVTIVYFSSASFRYMFLVPLSSISFLLPNPPPCRSKVRLLPNAPLVGILDAGHSTFRFLVLNPLVFAFHDLRDLSHFISFVIIVHIVCLVSGKIVSVFSLFLYHPPYFRFFSWPRTLIESEQGRNVQCPLKPLLSLSY